MLTLCPQLRRVVERHIHENINALPTIKAAQEKAKAASTAASPLQPSAPHSAPRDGRVPSDVPHAPGASLPPKPAMCREATSSDSGAAAVDAADRARQTAVAWRVRARELLMMARCWRALCDAMWRGRMRQWEAEADERASAARAAEIAEAHAANARLAKLAFAQAGLTPEAAEHALSQLLEPSDGPAARAREQLHRVLERDLRRRALHEGDALAQPWRRGVRTRRGCGRPRRALPMPPPTPPPIPPPPPPPTPPPPRMHRRSRFGWRSSRARSTS